MKTEGAVHPTVSRPRSEERPPLVADHTMLQRIGVGAYGEVWMARSITGALRAVKVVRREQFDHDRTYEREFAGLKHFEPISRTHEGLVDILQVGRNDEAGYFYSVMELADAGAGAGGEYAPLTLEEMIRARKRLPIGECARIGALAAEALGFLHRNGLVHRDVKPSNIIFVNGHPKLADIGLVTGVGAARSFVGTDGFIPPEGPGAPAADIYGFGKTLYEMATGKSRLDFPDVPSALETSGDDAAFAELNEIILRACAIAPAERHASAEELRGELLLLDAGRSIRRLRRNERLIKVWRRLGLAAALILLTVAVAFQLERERAESAGREALAQAEQRRLVETKERAAREALYAADMNLAQQALEDGNYGRAEALLTGYLPSTGREDLRGFEWFHLWKRARGDSIAVLRGHEHVISTVILGQKPDQLFSASFDNTIREWSLSRRQEIQRWTLPGSIFTSIALSPDGSLLAGEGDRPFSSILELDGGKWRTNSSTASSQILFVPGESRLVRGRQFKLFDTNGLTEIADLEFRVQKVLPESGARMAFSPLTNLLATGAWVDTIKLWTWPDLQPAGAIHGAGTLLCLRFSPDGSRLASVTRDGRLCLWDVAGRKLIQEKTAHGGAVVWSVAFSPDGARLATGGNDQAVRVWDAETLREIHVYRGHGSEVWSVIWSPDGAQLISSGKDQTIRIWNALPKIDTGEISSRAQRPIFSPDQRHVAAVTRGAEALVWETGTGRVAFKIEGVWEIGGFRPDGKALWILAPGWEVKEISIVDGTVFSSRKLKDPGAGYTKRALSQDGQWLATGYRSGEVFVHGPNGPEARLFSGLDEMIVSLSFSPEGGRLLAGSISRVALLWELETARALNSFRGHRMGIGSLAFSPDGQRIATASWDDTAAVWDTRTGQCLMTLDGHEAGVQAVAFTPDNRTLMTLTGTGILKFWSLPSQREAGQIRLRPGVNQGWLTVSRDGEWLAAVSQSEALTLVHAPREKSAEVR